jgi:hypothetical protein
MARERRLPSARSSVAGSNKQAKGVAETHDDNEKPAVEKDETSHAAASSAGDEVNKHDEPKQSSSSELEDTRTFQQLVHDYGDDSKWQLFRHCHYICLIP